MKDLISIIVPVYNSEQYIKSCIDSVLAQTYTTVEVLLIDDGSVDNSLRLCEMLCEKDGRVRLIRQEHKGVSAARNFGIEEAKGKYLFFLDSDDLIHPQLLEELYKLQETKHTAIATEELCYDKEEVPENAATWKTDYNSTAKVLYLDNKKALMNINKPIICGIGGKMIAYKAIEYVRFIENLNHGEDTLFIYQLLENGADISVLCCEWYYYRIHKNNISRDFSIKACRDKYRVICYICNHEIKNGREENAVYREWDIIGIITEWYRIGKSNRNRDLVKYAKNIARKERKRKNFNGLNWWMKLYYYLFLSPLRNTQKYFKYCENSVS